MRTCVVHLPVLRNSDMVQIARVRCGAPVLPGTSAPICCQCLQVMFSSAFCRSDGFQNFIARFATAYAAESRS